VGRFVLSIAFSLPLPLRADPRCNLRYDEAFGGEAHSGGSPKKRVKSTFVPLAIA
jgi:hypothetical protein